jgi:hypothetical protein
MKPDRIEQLIMTLRVRSRPNKRQENLDDILAAYDQSRQSRTASGRGFPGWVAKAAIAASVLLVVTYLAVINRDRVVPIRPKTKAVSSPAEIITAGSLQIAFRQGGLEGIERELDRAFEQFGPWPTVLHEQGLLKDDPKQNQGKEHEYEVTLPKHSYCLCLTGVACLGACGPGLSA